MNVEWYEYFGNSSVKHDGMTLKFIRQDPNLLLKPFNTKALLTIVNKDAVKNKKPKISFNIDLQPIELGAF